MDPGRLAVDVGGGEPIAVPPPVLASWMQHMQIQADGEQALAGLIDALDTNQGPQQAQQSSLLNRSTGTRQRAEPLRRGLGSCRAPGPWALHRPRRSKHRANWLPSPRRPTPTARLQPKCGGAARNNSTSWRARFYVPENLNTALLGLILKEVEGVPAEVVRQL